MNKNLLLALGFSAVAFSANAQRQCSSHDVFQAQIAKDSEFAKNQANIERNTARFAEEMAQGRLNGTQIVIPCIVHVVYANASQNISDAQIASQITRLNLDYGATNTDYSKTPAEFTSVRSGDTGIRFELLETKRYSNSKASWGTNDLVKSTYPAIEPTRILNFWVAEIGGGILGYAQFPGGAAATDGVVIGPGYFGDKTAGTGFTLSAPFDMGRTASHEVGHWLNLRHIWGDGNCTASDLVADTPAAAASNFGCPALGFNSCPTYAGNDMTMNYMDYTDDACMYMFSAGQKTRMNATFATGGGREGFKLTPVYVPGSGGGGGTTPTPVCGTTATASVAKSAWTYYTVTIPAGTASWTVTITGANGDADLYVRQGATNPTTTTYTARSIATGSNETITRSLPGSGTWKVGVYGYAAATSVTYKSCTTAAARGIEMTPDEVIGMSLYPNPASELLNVQVSNMKGTSVQIYNMSGQLMKQIALGDGTSSINIADLKAGVYIVKAVNTDGMFTERFIKE